MKQRMEFVATTGAKRNFEHDVPVPPSWVLRRSTRAESLFEKGEIRNKDLRYSRAFSLSARRFRAFEKCQLGRVDTSHHIIIINNHLIKIMRVPSA